MILFELFAMLGILGLVICALALAFQLCRLICAVAWWAARMVYLLAACAVDAIVEAAHTRAEGGE